MAEVAWPGALALGFLGLIVSRTGVLEGNLGTAAYRRRLQFEWILVLPGAVYLTSRFPVCARRSTPAPPQGEAGEVGARPAPAGT